MTYPLPLFRSWSDASLRILLLAACFVFHAGSSAAAPTLGFLEDWPDSGNVDGWQGNDHYRNPGHGGVGGPDDGYLVISNVEPFTTNHCGGVSFGEEYQGDWIAAGITRVEFWLNDIGADQPLEIHFGFGSPLAYWQLNTGFLPPENGWGFFAVNLGNSGDFTKIISFDTTSFATTLHNVDRIHFRHDQSPYVMSPDPIFADFGVDHLLLTNASTGVAPPVVPVSRPVVLAPPFPNPSRGPVMLAITTPDGGPVRVQVVDLEGRRVFHAELPAATPGQRLFMWNGLDDRGRSLPPGSYRVRAIGAGGGTSRSVVRVR